MKTILVTGGAGFIGSCFIRQHLKNEDCRIVNLDKLTYAGNTANIPDPPSERYTLIEGSIENESLVTQLLSQHNPDCIVNFAAESHVDRSIDGPREFLNTNVAGTVSLLNAALQYCRDNKNIADSFRFLQVSTDEVYGSLGPTGFFTETTSYQPNSPYSASKASADMFVRAYHETFGLPTLISNCSNNYGPYQFPEKLIPLMILNAAERKPLPIYGDGQNIRDWLFVEDHCRALSMILENGRVGEVYNIGGDSERSNLQVVNGICEIVDELLQIPKQESTKQLLTFVTDRPGHDRRYAIDASKIKSEIGWKPTVQFETGLRNTVTWYLESKEWLDGLVNRKFQRERLGKI